MRPTILVTGGTGTLGRELVPLLIATGRPLRVLSRHSHLPVPGVDHVVGDLLRDDGTTAAVADVGTVVHLAGGRTGDERATANLVRAAARAGVEHVVLISVIGADRVPLRYFRSKLLAEEAVETSGLPWTTLRAAQFHPLVLTAARSMARLPVVPAPGGLRLQPVDPRDVAARLLELTLAAPAGRVADLAGPRVHPLDELVRGYLAARGMRRPFLPVRIPGRAGAAYRAGANLNLDTADRGHRTWEAYLDEQLTPTAVAPA